MPSTSLRSSSSPIRSLSILTLKSVPVYGAWGLPATYFIGPKGEGLARGWGPADWYGKAARKLIKIWSTVNDDRC